MFGCYQPDLSERKGISVAPKADEDRAEPTTLTEVVSWTEAEHLYDGVTVHSMPDSFNSREQVNKKKRTYADFSYCSSSK